MKLHLPSRLYQAVVASFAAMATVGYMLPQVVAAPVVITLGEINTEVSHSFVTDDFVLDAVRDTTYELSDGSTLAMTRSGGMFWGTHNNGDGVLTGEWRNTAALAEWNSIINGGFTAADLSAGDNYCYTASGNGGSTSTATLSLDSSLYTAGSSIITIYVTATAKSGSLDDFSVSGLDDCVLSYATNNGNGFVDTPAYSSGASAITLIKATGTLNGSDIAMRSSTGKNGWQSISYAISAAPAPEEDPVWNGTNQSYAWDTTTANWKDSTGAITFTSGKNAIFNSEAAYQQVSIDEAVQANKVTIDCTAYIFNIGTEGSLSASKLTVTEGSSLALCGGAVNIKGSLSLGEGAGITVDADSTLSAANAYIAAGASLTVTGEGSMTITTLSGAGDLIVGENGTATVTALNSYTGELGVTDGGTLVAGAPAAFDRASIRIDGGELNLGGHAMTNLKIIAEGTGAVIRNGSLITNEFNVASIGLETDGLHIKTNKLSVADAGEVSFLNAVSSTTGGAIFGTNSSTITLNDNESVTFSGNSVTGESTYGGAIFGNNSSTITLNDNESVTFSGNSVTGKSNTYGGAIASRGTLNLTGNGSVMFSGNSVTGEYAYGGAICADSGTITLSNNEIVTFSGNSTTTSDYTYGGAIASFGSLNLTGNGSVMFSGNDADSGGAIYAVSGGTITFSNNGSVTFSENSASGGGAICAYSGTIMLSNNGSVTFSENFSSYYGGAICGSSYGTISLTDNESVTFSGNSASKSGGAIHGGYSASSCTISLTGNSSVTFSENSASSSGGAICAGSSSSCTISLTGNSSVTFSENTAFYGGAIGAESSGTITISNNGSVTFSENSASEGGAIGAESSSTITLNLTGNEHVLFRGNYEHYEQRGGGYNATYKLRSVYGYKISMNLSAGAGQDIVFYDTLYAGSASTVSFNAKYVNKEGVEQEATGDIVFSGKHAEEDLKKLKADYTAQELTNSLTTEVDTTTNLYGGRLRIEDGAIYKGSGINVAEGSHATLRLSNGELNFVKNYSTKYDVTLASSTTLDLQGVNKISVATLDMQDGSILSFTLGETNLTKSALTLDGIFNQGGNLTISIQGDETYDPADTYMLITMASGVTPETWDIYKITPSGADTNVNHLRWENGVLYYQELPPLVTATWSGEQSRVWNFTDKNWTQDGNHYRYQDGVDVVFGDTGSGEVVLTDEVAPLSVLVENSAGHDYAITGEGSLAGATALTKEGAGKLTIATANTYVGGTVINGGTVVVDNSTALGSGDVALNGAELNVATDAIISGQITVNGESVLSVADGHTLALGHAIIVNNNLEMKGRFDIGNITGDATGSSIVGGHNPANGFVQTAYELMLIDTGLSGEFDWDEAEIYHGDIKATKEDWGGVTYALTDARTFYINKGEESVSTARSQDTATQHLELINMSNDTTLDIDVKEAAIASIELAAGAAVTLNTGQDATIESITGGTLDSLLTIQGTTGKTLTLMNASGYAGSMALNSGTVVAGNAAAFGRGTIHINGGTLDLGGCRIINKISAENANVVVYNGYLSEKIQVNGGSMDMCGVQCSDDVHVENAGKVSFRDSHYLYGGSLGSANYCDREFINNDSVNFINNYSFGQGGGAINLSTYSELSIIGNGIVEFNENNASTDYDGGGAIYAYLSTLNFACNEEVSFRSNSSSRYGGAIYLWNESSLNITNNKRVQFIGNFATRVGAIMSFSNCNLTITGNDHVEFRGNYAKLTSDDSVTYFLSSIYASSDTLNFAAGKGQDIVFFDPLFAASGTMVFFNDVYEDKDGVQQYASGDIVFSGRYAENDLAELKPNYTQQELVDSLTTEVYATTNLYGGRLRIEDGAIYKGNGINVAAESVATLRLANGTLDQAGYEVTLNSDTMLELQGVNSITAAVLDMQDGSTLSFNVGEENLSTPVITLSGSLNQGGNLTIMLTGDTLVLDKEYALLQMSDSLTPSTWDWSKISVSGLWVDKNALNWSDGTLYLTLPLPELETATWRGAQSREWNFTEKNWSQGDYEYRYKDGVNVVFGDEGCGEVALADELAPLSVLVENSEGHDYIFTGDGKLTGGMQLTKEGDGTLTISTANDYTGGTVINGGVVVVDNATALGSGDVALNGVELNIAKDATISGQISAVNENTLVVEAGHVLTLGYSIANSGAITMQGEFDISALSCEVVGSDYMGGALEGNGFARTLHGVQVVDNGAAGYAEMSGATFFYNKVEWAAGDEGYAVKATVDYSAFYVNSGTDSAAKAYAEHTPASIQMQDGTGLDLDLAGVDIPGIELTANTFTATLNVKQTSTIESLSGGNASSILSINGTLGKSLTLVDASSFIGTISLTDTALQVGRDLTVAGSWTTYGTSSIEVALDATLTLGKVMQNTGKLSLSGAFDISALSTIEREHTYTGGATDGNGFFTRNYGIQVVNNTQGGTSDLTGGTFLYNGEEWAAGGEGYAVKAMADGSVFYVNRGTDSAAKAYAVHTPTSIQMQDGTGLDLDLAGADIPSIELAANAGTAALNIKQATTVDSISDGGAATTLSIGGTTGKALTIMDASSYQGTFVINSGTLAAGGDGALGMGDIQMNGGRLDLGGNTIYNAVNATGEVTIGNGYLCSNLTLDGTDLKIDKDLSLPLGDEVGASPLWQIRVTGETESSIAVAKGAVLSMCMPIYNEAYVSLSGKIDIWDMGCTYVGTSYKGGEIEGNGFETTACTAKVIDNAMGAAFDWKKAEIYFGDILATKDKSGSVSFEIPHLREFYIFSGTEKVSTARSHDTAETPLDYIYLCSGTTLRVDEDFDLDYLYAEDGSTLYVEEGKTLRGTYLISNTALTGAGKYTVGEDMTLGTLYLSNNWTGVVSLSGEAEDIDLDEFWREGSWVELNGLKTLVTKTNQSISADIILTDMEDGTAAYCTALTERTIARSQIYTGAIKGDGTFVVDVGKNNYMYCEFNGDISAWTGEFRYVGEPEIHLTIAGDAKEVNAAITGAEKLDLRVKNNAEFNGAINVDILSLANSSSEFNGAINVNKLTLTNSSATFNGELQVKTGISTSETCTFTVGEGQTYTLDTAIANSGDLTLHGTFDASGLPRTLMGGEYVGAETEGNGYYAARYGILVVKNASQATLDWDDAKVIYKDIDFEKRANGVLAYNTIDNTMFYVGSGAERVSSAQDFAAAAGIEMKGICMFYDTTLVVDRDISTEIIQPYYDNCNFTLNIENGATLQSEGTERLLYSVTGSGTYRLVEGTATLDTSLNLDWCGTVVITSAEVDNFDLNQYGYEGGAVRLDSVSGSLVVPDSWDAYVFSPTLDLAGNGFEITLCGGEDVYEFAGGVRGAGNLTYNPGKFAHNETYIFSGDVSEWTGAFESGKDKKESWLVFRGDATEMGAAIKQTAGSINVEVGNGSAEHTTAFKNEVEATTFTVHEKATAVIENTATITESLSLQGTLEVNGGSLNLAEDAVVEVGEAYTIAGREGSAPSISGDIRMNDSGLHGTDAQAARIDHSVVKLAEGASVVFDNVILGATSRLTDDPATVVANNLVIEGILGENVQEGAPMTIKSGSILKRLGEPSELIELDSDASVCRIDITNVQDVQLTGNCLTIDLSSMYPKFKDLGESFDWLGIALGSGDHAPTIDENLVVEVLTLPNQRARGYVGWGGTFVTVPDHGENVGMLYFHFYEVPEPTTSTLSLLALAALAARRRRK